VAKSKYSIDCFLIFCKVSTPLVNTITVVRKKLQEPREWLILLRGMGVFIYSLARKERKSCEVTFKYGNILNLSSLVRLYYGMVNIVARNECIYSFARQKRKKEL
jgi:hypothetical protein